MAKWVDCALCEFNVDDECHRFAPRPIVMFEGDKGERYEHARDEYSTTELKLTLLTVWPLALDGCGEGELAEEAKTLATKTV